MSAEEKAFADVARERYEFHQFRLQREARERHERLATLTTRRNMIVSCD